MLNLKGNLCEMGDLDGVETTRGLRIERADGSVVQITGLTKEEVRGLDLFADVTLSVSSVPAAAEARTERALIAAFVESKAQWDPCDCGCPGKRTPKGSADVDLIRLAAAIRMGRHTEGEEAEAVRNAIAALMAPWPEGAAFIDEDGRFYDEQGEPLPVPALVATTPRPRSELEMLGYELDGVLADVKHGQGGALDAVCQQTVTRVSKRLHELGRQQRKGDPK